MGNIPTGLTSKLCLADAVLGGCEVTHLAAVRGVPGIDVNHSAPSFFRFGVEDVDEGCPARVVDRSVESRFRRLPVGQERFRVVGIGFRLGPFHHVGDPQVLDDYEVEILDEGACDLVVEVPSGVGDLAIPGGNRLTGTPTVGRTTPLAGRGSLGCLQAFGSLGCPAGVVEVDSLGGDHKRSDADVDAGYATGLWKGLHRHFVAGQDEVPLPPASLHGDRFHGSLNGSVDGGSHVTDPLEIDPRYLGLPLAPVPIGRPLHRVEAVGSLETGISGSLSDLDSSEEGGKGLVETAESGLLGGERPLSDVGADTPYLFQLGGLSVIGDADSTHLPGSPSFF